MPAFCEIMYWRLWLLWEDLLLTFVSPFLSALLRSRRVSTRPAAEHVCSRRAAHGGGHFDCCKMLESAIRPCCTGACNLKYMPIQVRCSQCTNGWSQQLKHMGNFIFIFIWLNCWLGFYPVCTSKPINFTCEFLLKVSISEQIFKLVH